MTTDTHSNSTDGQTDHPVYVDGTDHLQTVVDEHDVVLVDFYADWCGPCKMIEPTLERLATETDAVIAKVDVDQHQLLAGEYGVRGVPTLVLFAGGQQVERHTGVLPGDQLKQLIDAHAAE